MILNLVETRTFFFFFEEGEKEIWTTENGSAKRRCETKSSAITTLFPEITS